jgi:TDG/mug DNA glycosylase family protein
LKSQFIPQAYPNPMPRTRKAVVEKPAWADLRLTDRIEPGVRVLLIGINPGVRSAETGHHFAGPSNRFWKLLYASGVVPEPITHEGDVRLPEWGVGITNLIARPTPGIDSLRPDEYAAGAKTLRRKIRRVKPQMVAFIGVTLFRSFFGIRAGQKVALGPREERIEGARVFVLPNPSGRNANFSYEQMLDAFAGLRRAME